MEGGFYWGILAQKCVVRQLSCVSCRASAVVRQLSCVSCQSNQCSWRKKVSLRASAVREKQYEATHDAPKQSLLRTMY